MGAMALRWYTVVVDSRDPSSLARWWAETLGWVIVFETDEEVVVVPSGADIAPRETLDDWLTEGQGLVFVPVPEGKELKNRLHIDLAPHTSQDREAEIARLKAELAQAKGDDRDTTTPAAMANTLQALLTGDLVAEPRPDWELAASRLRHAPITRPRPQPYSPPVPIRQARSTSSAVTSG